ncbi:MAG: CAF17-like 4Fe-4S cluster assembly/insertion protein YgfZ [Planctomycetota bacterium]|jgi:folate-binding protein YgfZ
MRYESPLRSRLLAYQERDRPRPAAAAQRPGAARGVQTQAPDIEYIAYGPADGKGRPACGVVATLGDLESEYAALRKGAGLLDSPHRGTIRITGNDRRDFLNRMLTQELKDLDAGVVKSSFWLNRKGRIEADLLLIELGDQLLVDVDVHGVEYTVETLGEYLFTEDVQITDISAAFHHIAVHGRQALDIVAAGATSFALNHGQAATVHIAEVPVVVARHDMIGDVGLELISPYDEAGAVWDALLAADETIGGGKRRIRPIGWHAVNVARIEAGTPLFRVDFGPKNLPHETGLLHDRVSFTKGCYLGQEIVARTESLGRPKHVLVGLRMARDLLPMAEAQVFEKSHHASAAELGPQIGLVTSSTLSPMLGAAPIAFAQVRTEHAEPGTTVLVDAEGHQTEATVGKLRFWGPEPHTGGEA